MGASASSSSLGSGQHSDLPCLSSQSQFSSAATSSSNLDQLLSSKDKKKKVATLSTLRKRLIRRRRASKSFDHAQVFHEFLTEWSPRDVVALVREYEATATLKDLVLQADAARPSINICRKDLGVLFERKYCTDITLVYHGTSFPAHRAILSIRCPFFRELLSDPATVGSQIVVEIDIPGVSVEMFNDLLRYLYTGELSVAENYEGSLSTLIQLSEQFGIPNPLEQDLRYLLESGIFTDACVVFSSNGANGGGGVQSHYHFSTPKVVSAREKMSSEAECSKSFLGNEVTEFLCHKAILAARSPFFRNYIQRHQRRSAEIRTGSHIRITLDESIIPLKYSRIILWSMYQDSVDFPSLLPTCYTTASSVSSSSSEGQSSGSGPRSFIEEVMELYEVSRLLELDSLTQNCEDVVVELISLDNLTTVLKWSEQPHGSSWVYRQAVNFMREEFCAISASPVLYHLSRDQLLQAIKSDYLQASELEVLVAVLKWGEHQLLKRMEEREPNVVSHTAHSVTRKGLRRRELSDSELRDVLSELLAHVRTDHILPANSEALLTAVKRGLVRTPPTYMLGDDSCIGSASVRRAKAWVRGKNCGLYIKPRLFMPYVEEAKAWLEEHLGQEAEIRQQHPWHLSHIPDTLYMVEKSSPFQESCPSLPHLCPGPNLDVMDGAVPVPDDATLRQMKKREQELRQSAAACRAYSLVPNRCDVTRQIQLRVVREFGLPDQAVNVLHCPAYLFAEEHAEGEIQKASMTTFGPKQTYAEREYIKTPSRTERDYSKLHPEYGMLSAAGHMLEKPRHIRIMERYGRRNERRALRVSQLPLQSENHLSDIIPDIAMATAMLEHMEISESEKDSRSAEVSPIHMLV